MKKLLAIFFAILFLALAFPFSAFAAEANDVGLLGELKNMAFTVKDGAREFVYNAVEYAALFNDNDLSNDDDYRDNAQLINVKESWDKNELVALYFYFKVVDLDVDKNSDMNKIQIGSSLNATDPITYNKYAISFVEEGRSEGQVFQKYMLTAEALAELRERINADNRIYDISGVELVTRGDYNATEYDVASVFTFGTDAQGNLVSSVSRGETIKFPVYHTSYVSDIVSSGGEGYNHQLNSVYFSVPKHYLDNNMYSVKYEYWCARTNPIVVTANEEMYDALYAYLGRNIEPNTASVGYGLGANNDAVDLLMFNWAYNINPYSWDDKGKLDFYTGYTQCSSIDWLFYHSYKKEDGGWTVRYGDQRYQASYGWARNSTIVGSEELEYYARWYTEKHSTDEKIHGYSKNLFFIYDDSQLGPVPPDGNRHYGHIVKEVTTDDYVTLPGWGNATDATFFERLFAVNWFKTTYEDLNFSPLQFVSDADVTAAISNGLNSGKDEKSVVSDAFFIAEDDVDHFTTFVKSATVEDKIVVLLRFDESEVYRQQLAVYEYLYPDSTDEVEKAYVKFLPIQYAEGSAILVQEDVYLDFDIIALGFKQNGAITYKAVANNPMDIFPDIVVPDDWQRPIFSGSGNMDKDDWSHLIKILVAIIFFVLLVAVVIYLWPYIGGFVMGALRFLWRLIKWPFDVVKDWIKSGRRKR